MISDEIKSHKTLMSEYLASIKGLDGDALRY